MSSPHGRRGGRGTTAGLTAVSDILRAAGGVAAPTARTYHGTGRETPLKVSHKGGVKATYDASQILSVTEPEEDRDI